MQRKPGFPVANCAIKMPEVGSSERPEPEEESELRRQLLVNFGHSQWGFNNWSWSVTKQDLDFVELTGGKYSAGVVAFVSVTVKSLDIHRQNIGYASSLASQKGSAIYMCRKSAVTNALRETLLSFGGSVATELLELLESHKSEPTPVPEPLPEANQNSLHKEPKNAQPNKNIRKDSIDNGTANHMRHMPPAVKNIPAGPPLGLAPPPPRAPRPPSNVSIMWPVVGGHVYGGVAPQRLPPPPHLYPNCYEYAGPWHFAYEPYDRHHGNVNLNFNMPPKNLVVNGRPECKNACSRPGGPEGEPLQYGGSAPGQGQCWVKPTIFYDGFWTEQKVKRWVAEQVDKQCPEETVSGASPHDRTDSSKS